MKRIAVIGNFAKQSELLQAVFDTICTERGSADRIYPDYGCQKTLFAATLKMLEGASLVVVLLDDLDPDTALQIGYALARGKTVIGFRLGDPTPYSLTSECCYHVKGWQDLRETLKVV